MKYILIAKYSKWNQLFPLLPFFVFVIMESAKQIITRINGWQQYVEEEEEEEWKNEWMNKIEIGTTWRTERTESENE